MRGLAGARRFAPDSPPPLVSQLKRSKKRAARGRPLKVFGRGCLKGKGDIALHNELCNCEIDILDCKYCNHQLSEAITLSLSKGASRIEDRKRTRLNSSH